MEIVSLQFVVGSSYRPGDYAVLHGNRGDGNIDWAKPLSARRFNLFPNGNGLYGFGHAPFGRFPFGYALSIGGEGFGHAPFGRFPFGHAAIIIATTSKVTCCGLYRYAFAAYDSIGNIHEGEPETAQLEIHTPPAAPTGLKKVSYDSETKILLLEAA